MDRLHYEGFGKRIIMTDQHEWTTEQIIQAYRGQSDVEAAFRQIKDPLHLAVRPQFHWTDHKVRVHTFVCLVALLLSKLIERQARQSQFQGSLSGLLDMLGSIRLGRITCRAQLHSV